MKNLIVILSLFLFITSCDKNEDSIDEKYPNCLQFEIDAILDGNPTTIKANIKKYKYQEILVYAFYEGNVVEGQTRVYTDNCIKICEFGGIGGLQINTCDNWDSAELIEIIWEDPR